MNGHTEPSTGQVYVTRDCMHFRMLDLHTILLYSTHSRANPMHAHLPGPLPRTPLAPIAARLFALLRGTSEASQSARRAFAHCIVDHALPLPTSSNYSSTVDSQIKELFTSSPPLIACVQGPLKVDFLHAQTPNPGQPRSIINTTNSLSNGNTSEALCLHNMLFFGYTLHNELTRCQKEDPDQYGRYCFFFLCALGELPFTHTHTLLLS